MYRILDIRRRLKLTQAEMAERLGLSQSRVSHLESGAKESGAVKLLLDQMAANIPAESVE